MTPSSSNAPARTGTTSAGTSSSTPSAWAVAWRVLMQAAERSDQAMPLRTHGG